MSCMADAGHYWWGTDKRRGLGGERELVRECDVLYISNGIIESAGASGGSARGTGCWRRRIIFICELVDHACARGNGGMGTMSKPALTS